MQRLRENECVTDVQVGGTTCLIQTRQHEAKLYRHRLERPPIIIKGDKFHLTTDGKRLTVIDGVSYKFYELTTSYHPQLLATLDYPSYHTTGEWLDENTIVLCDVHSIVGFNVNTLKTTTLLKLPEWHRYHPRVAVFKGKIVYWYRNSFKEHVIRYGDKQQTICGNIVQVCNIGEYLLVVTAESVKRFNSMFEEIGSFSVTDDFITSCEKTRTGYKLVTSRVNYHLSDTGEFVKSKKRTHNDITFYFNGKIIRMDDRGRIKNDC